MINCIGQKGINANLHKTLPKFEFWWNICGVGVINSNNRLATVHKVNMGSYMKYC